MLEVQYKVDLPAFTGRNVPIKEIANAIGKDAVIRNFTYSQLLKNSSN